MAKETTKDVAKREVDKLNKQAEINEAYFVGLLWLEPFDHYSEYSEIISQDEFVHDVWGFYYELGRKMYSDGIKSFDDITVHTKVKEYNLVEEFNKYGKMETIDDTIGIVEENADNIEYYYETIKRTYVIRQLIVLFGAKVVVSKGKYKWQDMTREQLTTYWNDKVNLIALNNVNKYEAENLYIDPDLFIKKLKEDSAEMLPFYKSYMMNSITQGLPRGTVTMFGGFGNTGKSSIMAEKFVMSCIENKEKMIIVLNEEGAQAFRQKIVLSLLWHEFGTGIDRKRMVNGKLTSEDENKIRKAFNRMNELMDGEESQLKVIFMDRYVMKDLEKIVRFWANRGYINILIDTHKVSDNSPHEKRWETFVEDMKTIYRFTREDAGGLNLRTVVTIQLADSAIGNRYLDFDAIGEGRASKNEAGTVLMFRPIWGDEYEGEKNELECFKKRKDENGNFETINFKLEKKDSENNRKTYYLLFTPKNRTGSNNNGGQPVLVLEPIFNFNHFKEIGWTFVKNEKARR